MDKERLYESINNIKDERTRRILYIEFIQKYYPKCYEAFSGRLIKEIIVKQEVKEE